MTWRTEPPTSRVWALILPRYAVVPAVAQWEPSLQRWINTRFGLHFPDNVEWHPLPNHPAFDARTHAVEGTEQ